MTMDRSDRDSNKQGKYNQINKKQETIRSHQYRSKNNEFATIISMYRYDADDEDDGDGDVFDYDI